MYDDGGAVGLAEEVDASPRLRGGVARIVFALLLGLVVGAVGTAIHRTLFDGFPLGLVLALALTLSFALTFRAWAGWPALIAMGLGWLIAVHGLSLLGPGGDVLVIDPSAPVPFPSASVIWSYAGIALIVATALLPRRWFARESAPDESATLGSAEVYTAESDVPVIEQQVNVTEP